MEFTNDEQHESFRTTPMVSLPYSRNFGGIRHGFNNPMRLSGRAIPYSTVASISGIVPVPKNAGVEGMRVTQGENEASHGYVSHGTPSNIDPTIDTDPDCLMTTPLPSRNQSESASNADVDYCQCQEGASASGNRTGKPRPPPLRLASDSRLPSIAMMLNESPSDRASLHLTGNYALPIPIFDNRRSLSDVSGSTIVGTVSIPEQRYFLLNTLYQICLDATTTYIRALPQSSHSGLRWEPHHSYSNRYHPYRGKARKRLYNDDQSKTLMDNIEVISTFLWKKARRDEMAPHRAESDAVMDMHNLYKWGANLVGGMEERARDEEARTAVLHAGMAMCDWLKVSEPSTLCKEVEGELRDLTNLESQRMRDEDDEDDGIL
ncbi:hypothetical protein MFRU_014g02350 [Monilinia fructicola]|uniref:Uncharacterized protein n=1 Tax=Monilinia fructicola TaxID=38448 RepID=A0A5M9K6U9_MONFR|nr:hypothetical protein EYC84_006679 [Monilinia fructicola]KAG4029944.1 hypothetical protein MFRU_014g02350 [Monilinia fructicola]